MVSVDSRRVSRAPRYSGTGFESRSFSSTRLSRFIVPFPNGLQLMTGLVTLLLPALQPPLDRDPLGLGCCDFARHYFRNHCCFLFLQVLRWFTSLSLLVPDYCIHRAVLRFYRSGFPHSDIPESKPACGSSRLIAACHVLHRHLLPRHPPCALSNLTIKFTQSTSAASGRMLNFSRPGLRLMLTS